MASDTDRRTIGRSLGASGPVGGWVLGRSYEAARVAREGRHTDAWNELKPNHASTLVADLTTIDAHALRPESFTRSLFYKFCTNRTLLLFTKRTQANG